MLMHRLGRTIVRATSALTLLALLGGLPTALIALVGWPLPRTVPIDWAGWSAILTGGFPDAAVVGLLTIALWLVWAAFCYSLLGELLAARRGRPARTIRVISPMQALAALLIAGLSAAPAAASVAVIATPAPAVSQATTAAAPAALTAVGAPATDLPWLTVTTTASTAHPATTVNTVTGTGMVTAPPSTDLPRFAAVAHTGPLTISTGGQQYTVTVQRGDTLWEIAGTWLGDPHRWTEIYQLNADRYDSTGRMHGGDHIEPTWVLILPADATPPAGAQPAGPPAQTDPGNSEDPSQSQNPGQSAVPSTAAPSTVAPSTAAPSTAAPSTAAPSTVAPSLSVPDDGVVAPPVGTATGDASSSAGPSSSQPAPATTTGGTDSEPGSATEHGGVSLLSGSWVDVGLALAVIAAVALVWAHRRRRYTPRPPSPQLRLDDPDLAPMPPMISHLRHGLRRPVPDRSNDSGPLIDLDADDPDNLSSDDDRHIDAYGDIDAEDEDEDEDEDDADDGWVDEDEEDSAGGQDGEDDDDEDGSAHEPPPVVPALTNPIIAVWPPAGLGLTGPRAEDAARGFLAAALAAGAEDPQARTHVVMPSATAATLLGAAAVGLPDTPRLTITGGLDEALELLEAQTLHRTRLVYRHEVDSITQLRAADPLEEPVEPILLIADAAAGHERARVAALLAQGQRLDIHAVVLGAWPDGDTVVVADDGTTSPAAGEQARHGGHPADVGRLAVLTPAETADLIALLAESHTGHAPSPAPAEPPAPTTPVRPEPAPTGDATRQETAPAAVLVVEHRPADADTDTDADAGAAGRGPADIPAVESGPAAMRPAADRTAAPAADPANDLVEPPQSPDGPQHAPAPDTDPHLPAPAAAELADAAPTGPAASGEPGAADPDPAPDGDEAEPARDPVVQVLVLGPPQILDMDMSKGAARAKSVELLVYLAVHDGPVHYEPITDDLLPEAPAKRAPHRLHTYVSALRDVLRRTGAPTEYVRRSGDRYQLNRDVLDIDLWRMQQALRDAEQSTDPAVRIAAWRRAVELYRGDLAAGTDYEWIEPYREAVRQQVLDAVLALADALTDTPAEVLPILAAALEHNPYTEALYLAGFRAHAALGDVDAIRALRRTLTRRLAEIDAEPAEETTTLAEQLVARLQTPPRRTGPRPVARPDARPDEDAAA